MTHNRNFHADADVRIDNQRHAAIVIKDSQILLMHRIYEGTEFWVFPGGHAQIDEKPEDTVIREVKEETTIKVSDPKLAFEFRDYKKDNYDYYYICEYKEGEPILAGEEAIKNSESNFYEPMWIDLADISSMNILPKFAKEWVEENLLIKK